MYDIAIVGGGPAGLAAAVNARRRNKKTVVISKEEYSSKLVQSHLISNYLGFGEIKGVDLARTMRQHAETLETDFIKDEVQSIYPDSGRFTLMGRENSVEATSVILAIGISLGAEITGETELIGKGVSYCATCDGMFFKGKEVAIIGYIPEAASEAAFLAEICQKVYFLPQYKLDQDLDARVEVIGGKPLSIVGDQKVTALKTTAGEWQVAGVFIERAGKPAHQLVDGLITDNGIIVTDPQQATNIPGIFAAGDCTGKPWQIMRATGEGQVAALSAVHYLEGLEVKV